MVATAVALTTLLTPSAASPKWSAFSVHVSCSCRHGNTDKGSREPVSQVSLDPSESVGSPVLTGGVSTANKTNSSQTVNLLMSWALTRGRADQTRPDQQDLV
ncbi:unnamed protein product [Protopolystoma xenopodis]|uniref:Secreted protein n=1 Tax=Protopolystoma xenopodis TaxID=117903 RepID=A0A3S5BSQ9_9PLAT|nr:unnamed protein product [Protopolystoma xenopodis]